MMAARDTAPGYRTDWEDLYPHDLLPEDAIPDPYARMNLTEAALYSGIAAYQIGEAMESGALPFERERGKAPTVCLMDVFTCVEAEETEK